MEHAFQIQLLFGTAAIFAGYEAVKAEGWQRWLFWTVTGSFALIALSWNFISGLYAPATNFITSIATNPETWVVLFALAMLVVYASTKDRATIEKREKSSAGANNAEVDIERILRNEIGAIKSQAEHALAAHCALQNSDSAETRLSIETLEEAAGEFQANIEDIQRQIKIDMPNASTVCEAFLNLDQATDQRIRRIEGSVDNAKTLINSAHMEFVHLLCFGINVTTRGTLRVILQEKPAFNKLAPPIEDKERDDLIMEMRKWLQDIDEIAYLAAHGVEISLARKMAAQDAASVIRRMPEAEWPQGLPQLAFHDFFVVAHQCDLMEICLNGVIYKINHYDRSSLQMLREFYSARCPKKN